MGNCIASATHFAEERADIADLLQRGDHPVFLVEFVDEAVVAYDLKQK